MRRVVVTGLGIVSSIGHGAEEVTQSLREARSGVVGAPDHAKYGFRSQVWAPPKIGPWEELVDRRAARYRGRPMRPTRAHMQRERQRVPTWSSARPSSGTRPARRPRPVYRRAPLYRHRTAAAPVPACSGAMTGK